MKCRLVKLEAPKEKSNKPAFKSEKQLPHLTLKEESLMLQKINLRHYIWNDKVNKYVKRTSRDEEILLQNITVTKIFPKSTKNVNALKKHNFAFCNKTKESTKEHINFHNFQQLKLIMNTLLQL
jgi:benzoyl-CoA reductase/2-hydroxyglutaryl-CoA dehydratase subunit BcrC/BadD/HgdB